MGWNYFQVERTNLSEKKLHVNSTKIKLKYFSKKYENFVKTLTF